MQLKTLQWNIGGGMIRDKDADPKATTSYSTYDLDYIIEFIRCENPDIITLQESHAWDENIQAQKIAEALGYTGWINDQYGQSHIDPSAQLCQSIISRYPIRDHTFELFFNPSWEKAVPDGKPLVPHNKGMTSCKVEIEGISLVLQTLHAVAFTSFFNVPPETEEARPVLDSMNALMQIDAEQYLLQGDFNIDGGDLTKLFPALAHPGIEEFPNALMTVPKGRRYDRIIYRGLRPGTIEIIDSALTDHYPVITTFEA